MIAGIGPTTTRTSEKNDRVDGELGFAAGNGGRVIAIGCGERLLPQCELLRPRHSEDMERLRVGVTEIERVPPVDFDRPAEKVGVLENAALRGLLVG